MTAAEPWPSAAGASASKGRQSHRAPLTPYLDRATWVSRDFQPVGEQGEAFRQQVVRTLEQLSLHLSLRIGDFLIFEQGDPVALQRGDHLDNIDIL